MCLLVLLTLVLWQVNSLEDMRRFVMEHTDFSKAQGVVSKHVNVMSALSEKIAARNLMDVSTVSSETCGAYRGKYIS